MNPPLPSILLIEDTLDHARLLEKNMEYLGVRNEILHFSSGVKAAKFLFGKDAAYPPLLLILIDLNLPGITGIELLRQIALHDQLSPIPRMIITSSDNVQKMELCNSIGHEGYLIKPINYIKLAGVIHNLTQEFLQQA